MNIVLDTHAHTIVSGHAYNTIKEMVVAAKEKGLEAIALTEHAPNLPGTTGLFYFDNLTILPREMQGVHMLFGSEVNILDEYGNIDLPDRVCNKLDLVIASIHTPCYGESKGIVKNTQAYINVMKHPDIHIIGHPDDGRFPVDYDTLVAAAKENHVMVELNNSSLNPNGVRPNCRENQLAIMEMCEKYHAMVSLGSDAHMDLDLGNLKRVEEIMKEAKFPEELVINTSYEKLMEFIRSKQ